MIFIATHAVLSEGKHVKVRPSSLFSIVCILSGLLWNISIHSEESANSTSKWNGERRALTAVEKYDTYLSVGSVTCHRPATSGQTEQYYHGTGQITLAKDIVTTAAHNFIDHSTCKPWAAPWSCEFRMEDGKSYTIDMGRSRFGFSMKPEDWKNQVPGSCKTEKSDFVRDDWAVLKLGKPAESATPFPIQEMDSAAIAVSGAMATEVAGYTQSFLKDGKETPSVEKCRREGRSPAGGSARVPLLLADCGGGPGTSGSGLYTNDGDPGTLKLIAIYHGPLLLPERRISLYVPIAGAFLSQLRAATSQQ